ncbi:MAG: LPS export ABC transporter permease LptG [Deltaproteobacteria bacterium]|nr:LPS export ABC transporter permease LptG [Deltaproteobacteria bacterium]
MNIISKYLSANILKFCGIIIVAVIGIYLAVDFFEKIDNFLEKGVELNKAAIFFIFKIPFIISKITPIGILLSVIIAFSLMNKNNELMALKSCGISLYYIIKPVLFISAVFCLLLFLFSEFIAPCATEKSNLIWFEEVNKNPMITASTADSDKNIWIKGEGTITRIKYYEPVSEEFYGLSISFFDNDFNLIRKLDAKKAKFKDKKWLLSGIMEQFPKIDDNQIKIYKEKIVRLPFTPKDFLRVAKLPDEMSIFELFKYIKKVEKEGYDASKYATDFHAKIGFPFVCIIMTLIGIGLCLKRSGKDNTASNVSAGIGIAFLYWIFQSFCLTLGYGGMLHPIIAVWTPNFVFACAGIGMLLNED